MAGRQQVEQVVRGLRLLVGRWFGRADIHTPVNLAAVGVNDFAAQVDGQFQRQLSLAGGGRADNVNYRGVSGSHGNQSREQARGW